MKTDSLRIVAGQPSWRIANRDVEAYLTRRGGHLGPVTFDRRGAKLRPLSVAPWATEKLPRGLPPLLHVLRGDFFCMPFGGNEEPYRGEQHPPHGETANAPWRLRSIGRDGDAVSLKASLRTKIRPGRVEKDITLVDGHPAVYQRHTIHEISGPMNLGHHAMLRFPDRLGAGLISTSPFKHGEVLPTPFEAPEQGGYSSLKVGAVFDRLDRVPSAFGGTADLSAYPARRGFEDLVMLVSDPDQPIAWSAVTFPRQRCLWLGLKNPRVLRHTVMWISNGGRHYPPWNGRHVNVMGIEEVTAYFHLGLAASAKPNPVSQAGSPTVVRLRADRPTEVAYVMAAVPIPPGFGRVARVEPADHGGGVTALDASGKRAAFPVTLGWLTG